MSGTIMPPTKAIAQAVDLLEESVARFLKAKGNKPPSGKYESDSESVILFYVVLRNVEAICTLAKRDLVMIPSVFTLTRSVFEITFRILWMLEPDEIFNREARWLAHLAGEEDFYRRVALLHKEFGSQELSWQQAEVRIRSFRTEVEKLLPPTTERVKAVPSFRALLKNLGHENLYGTYMHLSQFAHGAHVAGQLYRKNLGCGKIRGEYVYPESWAEPLKCVWWCMATGGTKILERLGGNAEEFTRHTFVQKMAEALKKV